MDSSVVFVVLIISACIGVVSSRHYHHHPAFNIVHFGAIPDGKTDSRQSLLHTWQRVCGSKVPAVMVIPRGAFYTSSVGFEGPCSSRRVTVVIHGAVVGPANRLVRYMQLLALENVNNVLVTRLRFWNSQMFHISVNGGVNIVNAHIQVGDDCISAGEGTHNLWMEDIGCGPIADL